MNALERAVIEAARAWKSATPMTINHVNRDLITAVTALEQHEKVMAAGGIREIDWSLVAVGDEVQGKSGAFYPVLRTALIGDHHQITIRMAQGERTITITRPSESQPMAAVRRGQDGKAVDVFVDVLSSGDE